MCEIHFQLLVFKQRKIRKLEISLVFTGFFRLGIAAQLFGKIDILDWEQSEIHVIVQCFRADHFVTAEFSAAQGCPKRRIKRPLFVAKNLGYDKGEKSRHFQTTVDSSAIFAVFMVCMLPSIRLIPFLLPIV